MQDMQETLLYILFALIVITFVLNIVQLISRRKNKAESGEDADAENARAVEDSVRKVMNEILEQSSRENRAVREELNGKIDLLKDSLMRTLGESRETQQKALSGLSENNVKSMDGIRNKLDERLDKMQADMRKSLDTLQESNEKRLDEMRRTVDEKLEKTLETRLQKSFETVSTQLESVNKGLGEMKTVAESVGSLNKILSGSKTRGILGELQLGQIIEDMLPRQLYDKEVPTVPGSRDRVEYAIKLPGAQDGQFVYLPVDSKFPLDDYYRLLDGYENGDAALIDSSRKALQMRIKSFASDVKRKYISPPETTNFAILFLPTEGLYAEIAREPAFFDELRRGDILVAGPTTFAALLNSLQVGFKTLQIQKGAAEIETTLGAVKKEFENFEGILKKAHTKITQAGDDIEKLVGVRTRAINRRLRDVQTYDGEDGPALLGIDETEIAELEVDDAEDDR
ncbi:MAG: DNA recombination protein RmuC [Clostridiales Family XIII bacterium]|jgi:DNA recombination protein RmuC|nr:DNA recombination protein RmuC [Clostridiales Family XIII bacterium]